MLHVLRFSQIVCLYTTLYILSFNYIYDLEDQNHIMLSLRAKLIIQPTCIVVSFLVLVSKPAIRLQLTSSVSPLLSPLPQHLTYLQPFIIFALRCLLYIKNRSTGLEHLKLCLKSMSYLKIQSPTRKKQLQQCSIL